MKNLNSENEQLQEHCAMAIYQVWGTLGSCGLLLHVVKVVFLNMGSHSLVVGLRNQHF